MRILAKESLLTVGLVAAGLPANAGRFFSDSECALIVASRRTMEEVRLFHRNNPDIKIDDVYRAENGWFAISNRLVPDSRRQNELTWRKRNGMIPQDSYCSDGAAYVARVGRSLSDSSTSSSVYAPGSTHPTAEFDARPMSRSGKRFLQAALAYEGYYSATLDGVWGSGSQSALDRFAAEFDGSRPLNEHAALLMLWLINAFEEEGWQPRYFSYEDISIQFPEYRMSLTQQDGDYRVFEDKTTGVAFAIRPHTYSTMSNLHAGTANDHDSWRDPYFLRNNDLWVTQVTTSNNSVYLRSRYKSSGVWASTMIVNPIGSGDKIASLMISSIADGKAAPLNLDRDSYAGRILSAAVDAAEAEASRGEPEPSPRTSSNVSPPTASGPSPDSAPESSSGTSGTGFFVNKDGLILTNQHVIDGCESLRVEGNSAEVVDQNEVLDLATVSTYYTQTPNEVLTFSQSPPTLNSDITVAGFPLHGLLGGLNITRGSVSSLKGLGGDSNTIQISAPVQPGNSGGPAVDKSGEVVGVVSSKLDTVRVAEVMGDIPQNVNFAIRGDMARFFLISNGHSIPESSGSAEPLSSEQIGKKLTDATVLIECQ